MSRKNFSKLSLWFLLFLFNFSLPMCAEKNSDITDCVCGNGIQELLPQTISSCPYKLYGIGHNSPYNNTATGSLYYFNTYEGTADVIGTITTTNGPPNIVGISGMDFSPTGQLYIVGRASGSGSNLALATLDCQTAQATIIGTFNLGSGAAITAINFDAQGRLYGHQTAINASIRADGILGTFNLQTAAFTPVDQGGNNGQTGLNLTGNGIAFAPFPNATLYHTGSSQPLFNDPTAKTLSILDPSTGIASFLAELNFFEPTNNNPRINDMDFDAVTNTLYVSINDKAPGQGSTNEDYLGALDLDTGDVNYIKLPVQLAPAAMQAISVNRPYETCDQGMPKNMKTGFKLLDELPLPDGTSCSESCSLIESNCEDFIDNDFDGFIDCEDPDCEGLSCNSLGCSENICLSGTCEEGAPLDCDDFNDCTDDSCDQGNCLNETLPEGTPCDDFNPCTTGDMCFCFDEDCLEAYCDFSDFEPDGTPCVENPDCFATEQCFEGQCIGMELVPEICDNGIDDNCDELVDGDDPFCATPTGIEGECDDGIDNDADELIDCEDIDCNLQPCMDEGDACTDDFCQFLTCTHQIDDTNSCDDNNPCTDNDDCQIDGSCVGTPNDLNSCDDGNGCTINDFCSGGTCTGNPKPCNDNNPCTYDFCAQGDCSYSPLTGTACPADNNQCTDDLCNNGTCTHPNDNTNTCSDGLACTSGDHCSSGSCVGTPGVEICNNGIDDDCDFKIDNDDTNCTSNWLRVFVTSTTYTADFGGATQADALCQARATAASRTGTFKAFVSTSTSNAATRILNPNNRPWYLYSNNPAKVADNKTDLLDGDILQAIDADEFGKDIGNPKFAWTGSKTDGTLDGSNHCNNWTSLSSKLHGTQGATDKINYQWVNQNDPSCRSSNKYRLYCFQIEP